MTASSYLQLAVLVGDLVLGVDGVCGSRELVHYDACILDHTLPLELLGPLDLSDLHELQRLCKTESYHRHSSSAC
jgi:hypothetical protein